MSKKPAIAAAAVVVALGALAWWRTRPPPLAALGPGAYTLRYAFSMELARAGGGSEKISATLDGALDLSPGGEAGKGLVGRIRVASLTLDDGARRIGFLREGADRALATPFTLSLEADGRVAEVRTAPDLPLAVRAIVANIVSGAQYAHAAKPEIERWRTVEHDVNGRYDAEYRFESRTEVEKTWSLGADDKLAPVKGHGTARFSLDAARVRSVTIDERGDTLVGGADGPRSPFTLALALERTGEAETGWERGVDERKLAAFSSAAVVSKNLRVPGPEPRPLPALLDAVAKAQPKPKMDEHNALRDELTEAVIRDPAVGAALAKILRARDVETPQARLAVEALLGARTPDADASAGKLLVDPQLSALARTMLLGGATLTSSPGPRVVEGVSQLAATSKDPSVAGQAAMALGGLASALISTDKVKAAALAQQIVAMATHVLVPGPRDPRVPIGIKIEFLRALGNLGTPECLPLVRVGLADESEMVRSAAADGLRFQDPAVVKIDLDKGMRDTSANVRYSVLHAARLLGPAATLDLVKTALYFDKSEWVRLAAVYTVGAWSQVAPALLHVLTDAAPHEKSEKVRVAIRNMTTKNHVEPPMQLEHLAPGDP